MDFDKAVQSLPWHIQEVILDYVLDDIQYIDIQVQLGWTRKLIIPKDLEEELSRVIRPPEAKALSSSTTSYKRELSSRMKLEMQEWRYYIDDELRVQNRWITYDFTHYWKISKDNVNYEKFGLWTWVWA